MTTDDEPVRGAAAVRLTPRGNLARVTSTPPADPPVRTPPDAGTPTRVWLVALLTVLCVEMIRASGPLLDRAFAAGVVDAALTALGTYAAAGLVAALLLLAVRRTSGTPDARTLLVGAARARGRCASSSRPSTAGRCSSSAWSPSPWPSGC